MEQWAAKIFGFWRGVTDGAGLKTCNEGEMKPKAKKTPRNASASLDF
jgi:hypothetical protein